MHRTCFSFFHYDYKWEKFGVCASSIHLKLNRIRTKKRCLNQWPFGMVWATARKKGENYSTLHSKESRKGRQKFVSSHTTQDVYDISSLDEITLRHFIYYNIIHMTRSRLDSTENESVCPCSMGRWVRMVNSDAFLLAKRN